MVYVGLHITDPTGYEEQLEQFIKDNCIYERPDIPHNVAYNAKDINIFVNYTLPVGGNADFDLSFSNDFLIQTVEDNSWLWNIGYPIGYEPPHILIVSAVNFILEFYFNNRLLRLHPTEFLRGVPSDVNTTTIRSLIRQGCLRVYGLKDAEGWYWGDFSRDFNLDFDAEHELAQ